MSYQELSFRMVKLSELDELENYLTHRTSMETNQNVNMSCSSIGQAFERFTPIQSNRHGKKFLSVTRKNVLVIDSAVALE